ncbi:MAG: hypothetical protein LBC33_03710, partial [Mycoplasmataceae bacterium]|nr:hypothetical protein [Mycoplasmataceae bacterium]
FVLHLQKDYNKVLSAIKPLFPNDVYDDFVNSPINGMKNGHAPSAWFVERVKHVDKNDKWR